MNFLTNMRISHKISALMVGLIFGFIIIGVTYYVQIKIENDARGEEQVGLELRSQIASLNLALTQLTALGHQLIKQPSDSLLAEQKQSGTQIRESLASLKTLAATTNDTEIQQTLNQITNQFDQYVLLFQRAIDEQQPGSSPETDLQTTAAQAATVITNALRSIDTSQTGDIINALEQSKALDADTIEAINTLISNSDLNSGTRVQVVQALDTYNQTVSTLSATEENLSQLFLEITNAENELATTMATTLANNFSAGLNADQRNAEQRQVVQAVVTAIIFAVAMGTAVGVYFLYKSIVFPMVHMQSVIGKINRGKTGSRVKVLTKDELGDLGVAFNQLLDERIKQLEDRSLENDQLNNSIISLIKALGLIAQKDLTVKVPVSPDVTGTISDAVNLLTSETAKTLEEVKIVSDQVNRISEALQEQSSVVMQYADGEKRQIIATAKALEILARAMNEVANHAETADASATKAIENTQQARQSVEETVAGIRTIRETISETEKRTKRLGDRSQEISGIVNLINTIAERTHILALNASMHAASAGEAGRGFAVVADEVQRLAESARQSTDEIASMVNNMRVETSDTVNIMNTLISQVADGSRKAEEAGKRMAETENATQALVEDVKHIAKQATQQAEVANRVRDRSGVIRKFTEKTGKQLEEQKLQTDSLKQLADTLVKEVNVFTLPPSDRVINLVKATPALPATPASDDDDNISHLHAAS